VKAEMTHWQRKTFNLKIYIYTGNAIKIRQYNTQEYADANDKRNGFVLKSKRQITSR